MRLYLRLLWLILTQRWRSRLDLLDTAETPLIVLPNDLDVFMHVNNGVYLTYADLGRTDLMLRSGLFRLFRQNGWYPVVAEETIRFRKSLTLGQRFVIHTRVVGWQDASIYLEHDYMLGDTLVARAFIDGRILSRKEGKLDVSDALRILNLDHTSPALPEAFQRWVDGKRRSIETVSVSTGDDPSISSAAMHQQGSQKNQSKPREPGEGQAAHR